MKNLKKTWLGALLLLPGLLSPGATAAELADPASTVETFHQSLISAMQAGSYPERLAVMHDAVTKHFQLTTIARISLGRNWRTLDERQQYDFQQLLHQLVATTYASRFQNYDGQQFRTIAIEDISSNRKRVRTELVTRTETVSLDYQLQQQDGGWRIYDIVAQGVSDLALKRSSYTALYREGGVDQVQAEIKSAIAANQLEGNQTDATSISSPEKKIEQ